jgi:hypothetical protein
MLADWNRCQSVTVAAGILGWLLAAHRVGYVTLLKWFGLFDALMQAQNHPLMLSEKIR